jgi:hypothetical protein
MEPEGRVMGQGRREQGKDPGNAEEQKQGDNV